MSLVKASIETVVWEVVPELAESLIKAEIERIYQKKQAISDFSGRSP